MDEAETVAVLERQLTAAKDAGPDEDALRMAVDYYYGRPRGDELPGRSRVQSLDVADMIHAVLAQILPSFTQDRVCLFEPDGPGDDDQARLESDAVNYVLMESNRGYLVLHEALKDALLLKNGILKVYVNDEGDLRVEAVDPLGFYVGEEQNCVNLDDYRTSFCAERKVYSRGELVGMGLERAKVELLDTYGGIGDSEAAQVRYREGTRQATADAGWANETVVIYEAYARLPDEADSDETRLYRCLFGPGVLLLKEKADYLPYAAGSAFPESHRFWGLSMFDRLKTVQDSKTAIKRQWLDSLANCNNPRTLINDNVDREEYGDSRPGGAVSVRGVGPVQEACAPLPVIDAGPAAQAFLAYEDQVRADRGGAVLEMATAEAQLVGGQVGSQGVDRIFSVQEQMAGMIARNLAETMVRSVFLLVHRVLREEVRQPMELPLADQWVTVDPSQWRPRKRVNVRSGLTPGERSRKAAAMTQVLQMQLQAMQMGLSGALVAAPQLYTALLDWGGAQELDGIQKYFIDPRSQQAQAAAQQGAAQAQQMQAVQMQLMQQQIAIEQAKVQMTKYQADLENQFNYWKERLHAEIEEAKIVGAATADLQRIELEGRLAAAAPGAGNGESRD